MCHLRSSTHQSVTLCMLACVQLNLEDEYTSYMLYRALFLDIKVVM